MSWQALTILSILLLSISVLMQKILLLNHRINPYAFTTLFQGIAAVIATCFAIYLGFKMPDLGRLWFPMLCLIVLHTAGYICYIKALQKIEASVFAVLYATHTIWVMLIGLYLFHESLSWIQLIGVLFIFLSVIVLVKDLKDIRLNQGLKLGLLTGLVFGLAVTCWAFVGKSSDTFSWGAISFWGVAWHHF